MSFESALLAPGATIVAAFIGFLGGTVVNHWLAMCRSDRLNHDRQVDICQGLIAELTTNLLYVYDLKSLVDQDYHGSEFEPVTSYYDHAQGELGFLGWELLASVHHQYASLRAFSSFTKGNSNVLELTRMEQTVGKEIGLWIKESRMIEQQLFEFQKQLLRRSDRKKWNKSEAPSKSLPKTCAQ